MQVYAVLRSPRSVTAALLFEEAGNSIYSDFVACPVHAYAAIWRTWLCLRNCACLASPVADVPVFVNR